MGRMKAHWPKRVNAQLELKSARRWLYVELRNNPDVYRVLAIVQAIAIIDDALVEIMGRQPEGVGA